MRIIQPRKTWWNFQGPTPQFWGAALPDGDAVKQHTQRLLESYITPYILSKVNKDHKVLDAGCGPMIWGPLIAERGASYYALDFSFDLLKRGRGIYTILNSKPVLGNVKALPYKSNSLDLYLSLGILEHFPEGMQIPLEECTRVLKHGGVAIISVPYLNWIRLILLPFSVLKRKLIRSDLLRRLLGKNPAPVEEFYQYAYSLYELKKWVSSVGLFVVENQPFMWEYGLTRDYRSFRKLKKKYYHLFNGLINLSRKISSYLCAHMILIIVVKGCE